MPCMAEWPHGCVVPLHFEVYLRVVVNVCSPMPNFLSSRRCYVGLLSGVLITEYVTVDQHPTEASLGHESCVSVITQKENFKDFDWKASYIGCKAALFSARAVFRDATFRVNLSTSPFASTSIVCLSSNSCDSRTTARTPCHITCVHIQAHSPLHRGHVAVARAFQWAQCDSHSGE
jgi:hypothetical protein